MQTYKYRDAGSQKNELVTELYGFRFFDAFLLTVIALIAFSIGYLGGLQAYAALWT